MYLCQHWLYFGHVAKEEESWQLRMKQLELHIKEIVMHMQTARTGKETGDDDFYIVNLSQVYVELQNLWNPAATEVTVHTECYMYLNDHALVA